MTSTNAALTSRMLTSMGILLASLGLAYAPLPGTQQTIVVVSGTELQEPLQTLQVEFEKQHPDIKLELKFQGSQDMVNRFLDNQNDFKPTVLIPANGEILTELRDRWRTQNGSDPFYQDPRPIAKTLLVGIAWPERGKVLFPDGQFRWNRLEQAMQAGNWGAIGGSPNWGSFDFLTTNPTRSNSGQLTLSLWAQSKLGGTLTTAGLSTPTVQSFFNLAKRSVFQPPPSTDTLLQEFITRGPNEADVATVYESVALHRWQQAKANQSSTYQIYYPNPTVETVSTAVVLRPQNGEGTAKAGETFLTFLTQRAQQQVFVRYGFRPIDASIDLKTVPESPWNQQIPGVSTAVPGQPIQPPDRQTLTEILRQWERAN